MKDGVTGGGLSKRIPREKPGGSVKAGRRALFNLITMTDTEKYNKGYNQAIKDLDNFDWPSFRANAAKDILCASIPRFRSDIPEEMQVSLSIKLADKLIQQLREDEK